MNAAVMDFPNCKRSGLHYTALSRLRTARGGYFKELREDKIATDQRVVKEMARLRTERLVQTFVPCLWEAAPNWDGMHPPHVRVITLNVRSLAHHREDIDRDPFLRCADVLVLTETLTRQSTPPPVLSAFPYALCASHPTSKRAAGGVAIYSRHPFVSEAQIACTDTYQLASVDINAWDGMRVRVVGAYRHPGSAYVPFVAALSGMMHKLDGNGATQVLMGDLNMDCTRLNDPAGRALAARMQTRSMRMLDAGGATHAGGRQIDHIWTSATPEQVTQHARLWSYFSDHLPVYAEIRLGRPGEASMLDE
jgi:endonuclease/exonuclease/phosphatase (EEP) superfamily protein YafD